jgi:hypothetical protein
LENQSAFDVVIVGGGPDGLADLLHEVRFFAEDALLDSLKKLFHAHPDTEGGFDFEAREYTR